MVQRRQQRVFRQATPNDLHTAVGNDVLDGVEAIVATTIWQQQRPLVENLEEAKRPTSAVHPAPTPGLGWPKRALASMSLGAWMGLDGGGVAHSQDETSPALRGMGCAWTHGRKDART
eukprot:15468971-Alexandrium_andersonii.AAC.2